MPAFVDEQKARPDAEVACLPASLPAQHMAAMPEYSQSAYRFGEYVAKFGVFPKSEAQKALADWRIKPDDKLNVLATTLAQFHAEHEAVYCARCAVIGRSDLRQPSARRCSSISMCVVDRLACALIVLLGPTR